MRQAQEVHESIFLDVHVHINLPFKPWRVSVSLNRHAHSLRRQKKEKLNKRCMVKEKEGIMVNHLQIKSKK